MRIPRFLISLNSELKTEELVYLDEKETHHLKVLRLIAGTNIECFNLHDGRSYLCSLESPEPPRAICKVLEQIERAQPVRSILLLGMVSKPACELIVEKAVELGAAEIHFFLADNSQEKLSYENALKRLGRFERIRESAFKQSGMPLVTEIHCHRNLKAALEFLSGTKRPSSPSSTIVKIVFLAPAHPSHEDRPMAEIKPLNQLVSQSILGLEESAQSVDFLLMVGAVGGFSAQEIELALSSGFSPASLGNNVLRTETAAIVALGITAICSQL